MLRSVQKICSLNTYYMYFCNMKQKIFLLLFGLFLIVSGTNAQWLRPNWNYGTIQNRINLDSTILLPTGCGVPSGATSLKSVDLHKSAFYYDSCGHNAYFYDPSTHSWGTAGGSSTATGWNSMLQQNQPQTSYGAIHLANNGLEFDSATSFQIGTWNYLYGLFNLDQMGFVSIGDRNEDVNGTYIEVNDNYAFIRTRSVDNYGGDWSGVNLDFDSKRFDIGDWNNINNGTFIRVDDDNKCIYITANDYDNTGGMLGINLSEDKNGSLHSRSAYLGDFNQNQNGNYIWVNDEDSKIYTSSGDTYGNNLVGLSLDFDNKKFQLGDFQNRNNGALFTIDDDNEKAYTDFEGHGGIGLNVDYNNRIYQLGDYNDNNNSNTITIDDDNSRAYISGNNYLNGLFAANFGGADDGANTNGSVSIGDWDGDNNNTYLKVDDNNSVIYTLNGGGEEGFFLDFNTGNFSLGDYANRFNNNVLTLENDGGNAIWLNNGSGTGLHMTFNGSFQYDLGDWNSNNFIRVSCADQQTQFYNGQSIAAFDGDSNIYFHSGDNGIQTSDIYYGAGTLSPEWKLGDYTSDSGAFAEGYINVSIGGQEYYILAAHPY